MHDNISKIKILFLADTHLGFDYPIKPKITRRRRGDDFFNNYHLILKEAFDKKVDFVLHGGDMFFRAKVHQSIVAKAFEPLLQIAESGIPVLIVPGNHERSFLPVSLLETHPNIFVFDKARSFNFTTQNIKVCFSGFPCKRKNIRDQFAGLTIETGYQNSDADFKFLCMHQTVEGAAVGVQNYTFRFGEDIIKGKDIPRGFDALLSGHIHRAQILNGDLSGTPFPCPAIYPGAIERTSFAERDETKGYYILELIKNTTSGNKTFSPNFKPIYARLMVNIPVNLDKLSAEDLQIYVAKKIGECDKNAVVRITIENNCNLEKLKPLSAKFLRDAAPATMNIDLVIPFASRFPPPKKQIVMGHNIRKNVF